MKLTYEVNRITSFRMIRIMKLRVKLKSKLSVNLIYLGILHLLHWKICSIYLLKTGFNATNVKNDVKAVLREKDYLLVICELSKLFLFYVTSLFQNLFRRFKEFKDSKVFIYFYVFLHINWWSVLPLNFRVNRIIVYFFFIFTLCNKNIMFIYYFII